MGAVLGKATAMGEVMTMFPAFEKAIASNLLVFEQLMAPLMATGKRLLPDVFEFLLG